MWGPLSREMRPDPNSTPFPLLPLHIPSPPSMPPSSATDGHDSASAAMEKSTESTAAGKTSLFRGVTRHRWTGRYEAHLWDNTWRMEGQKRKGRQVYLGGYDNEENAARAYDLAALKYWGSSATTNFPADDYCEEMETMESMTKLEFVASIRRKSSGFSRGASIYRGVTRHHQYGRWQARIGRVADNKDIYLGTFASQEEAAEAYDVAAIKFRGSNAITNFDHSRYNMEAIENTDLPIGPSFKRTKHSHRANDRAQPINAVPANDPSVTVAYCDSGEAGSDLCSHNLLRFAVNSEHGDQITVQPVLDTEIMLHFEASR